MSRIILLCVACIFFAIGCAEIEPPTPDKILAPWSGTPPVQLGESKDSVKDKWGEPDQVVQRGADEVGLLKEEWVYRGRYTDVPVDYKYLSKTKRLMFTGESLTGYKSGDMEEEKP
jgi:hypothetical protein